MVKVGRVAQLGPCPGQEVSVDSTVSSHMKEVPPGYEAQVCVWGGGGGKVGREVVY